MVTSSYEANLIANVDEVGSEAKLGHGTEGDEEEKIWVVSRLEGSHLGGEREWCPVGRRRHEKFMRTSYTCSTC